MSVFDIALTGFLGIQLATTIYSLFKNKLFSESLPGQIACLTMVGVYVVFILGVVNGW